MSFSETEQRRKKKSKHKKYESDSSDREKSPVRRTKKKKKKKYSTSDSSESERSKHKKNESDSSDREKSPVSRTKKKKKKYSTSDSSESESDVEMKRSNASRKFKEHREDHKSSERHGDKYEKHDRYKRNKSNDNRYKSRQYSSDSDSKGKGVKKSWGLVTHDGKEIKLNKDSRSKVKHNEPRMDINKASSSTKYKEKLTEEEKEKRRREMMENAAWRDQEREKNVKRYKDEDMKESKQIDYNPDFMHNQMVKATASSSVESRIKSNVNNIQRSSRHMDKHFSRRH